MTIEERKSHWWNKYLQSLNITNKKIIKFIKKESKEWELSSETKKIGIIYKNAWTRAKDFYSVLDQNEKNFLRLFEKATWSTSVVYDFADKKRFYIYINEIGFNYYENKSHNPMFKGMISFLILLEIVQAQFDKNKLLPQDHYMFAKGILLDNFSTLGLDSCYRNIFIYGNGFTKVLGLNWANEEEVKKISSKLFPLMQPRKYSEENALFANTFNFYIDQFNYLKKDALLINIDLVAHLYNFSYEFKILYLRLFEKKSNKEIREINDIINKISKQYRKDYNIFKEKWKNFDWNKFPLEKQLMRSTCVMTTNYDEIFENEYRKPTHLHGDINKIQTDWFVEKYKTSTFDISNMLQCNVATFYGFSGDHDYHIIQMINGMSNIRIINAIDYFDENDEYKYFLKWLKWKKFFPSKNIFVFTRDSALERLKN